MIIQVDRIPWQGLDIEGELPAEVLALEAEADQLRVEGPLTCRLNARIVTQEVLVRGHLSVPVAFVCTRCGDVFSVVVSESRFEELYPFTDPCDRLDLTCDLRDSIILAFPSFPVCSETCKGVCPQCGANRNRVACSCREPVTKDCWTVLDGIPARSVEEPRG